jgi:NAD(P)-dependent dehydrogenase (short-subunit alcohol dehydrogenase family)
MTLTGQRIAILGGGSGIGLATGKVLASQGATVLLAGRNRAKVDAAAQSIGKSASAHVLDATKPETLRTFFEQAAPLHHLVLSISAGEGAGPFRTLELSRLRAGFEGKFWACVAAMQAALPVLQPFGSITVVTAISARTARPGTAGLAAINGALEAMIKPLAAELAPLRVNAVSPGMIETPWWDRLPLPQREAAFSEAASTLPVGRVGQPEEAAQAVVLLVTNGFLTGTVIECDGGARLGAVKPL